MKFIDPMLVTCIHCSMASEQRVEDLLGFLASCPSCGSNLNDVGQNMCVTCDESNDYFIRVFIALDLEKKLGTEITDAELKDARTLRNIANAIECHMPPSTDRKERSIALILEAAKAVPWCSALDIELDIDLVDAINPGRWKRNRAVM